MSVTPKVRYVPDDDRYLVYLGDERIGFVRHVGCWYAADTFMEWSGKYSTRERAGRALRRKYERDFAAGRYT